jgi:ankyrin repeat protein
MSIELLLYVAAVASGALAGSWLIVAGLSVPAVAALAVGMRVRSRIEAQTYRAWLRKALWLMAFVLIAQFFASAFASEPLFSAIDDHREGTALELVEKRQADFEARNPAGDTVLHRAVETGMRRLLQALLAAGADPRARTKNGEAALHLAALHPEPVFTDLLLAAGADPRVSNADGESPLHWAALSGHIVIAQRLLARGADPRAKTRQGLSARDYARREGHQEIAKLLERFDQ